MSIRAGDSRGVALLRIYTLAGDRVGQQSLAEALVRTARAAGLAGATVLCAQAGYGRHGFNSTLTVFVYRPERQPLVVEIADTLERLEAFLGQVRALNRRQRLVTLERIAVHAYGAAGKSGTTPP